MSINLTGILPRYQYLRMFDANKDKVIDEKDNKLFEGADSAQAAETVVMENLAVLSEMPGVLSIGIPEDKLPGTYIKTTIAEITEGRTGIKRRGITDGDTIKLECDINKDEKLDIVRFKGINTTEFGKGPTLESRLKKADPGAIKAWEKLNEILKLVNYEVYVAPERFDGYGRFVSQVFIKIGTEYIDIEAYLASEGLGMTYFVQVDSVKDEQERYVRYLLLQAAAQKNNRGLWSLPEFHDKNDPLNEEFKPLYITSFHPNAKGDRKSSDFLMSEFQGKYAVDALCLAMGKKNGTLDWLNEVLRTPNYYKTWAAKHPDTQPDKRLAGIIEATKKYRNREFDELTEYQQKNIKRLNRMLIEADYPEICPKNSEKNFDEPLYNEYTRLVNTSGKPLDLEGFKIFNKVSGKSVEMPSFILPPGRTLKIATGDIKTNSDPAGELIFSLGKTEEFWDEEAPSGACLVIRNPDGKTVDSAAKYKYEGCE